MDKQLEQKIVKLIINDNEVFQYDRKIKLPENQLKYLQMMDHKMDNGITLSNELINNPTPLQKSQFVTFNMLSFIEKDQQQDAIAMFSYIVHFQEKLKQLKVIDTKLLDNKANNLKSNTHQQSRYKIEFVYYKDLSNWETIKFH